MNFFRLFTIFIFLFCASSSFAQSEWKPVALSQVTGLTIDAAEKEQYGILTFWKKEEFDSAQCFMRPDSSYVINGWLKNNSNVLMNCSRKEFHEIAWVVNYRAGLIKEEPFDWFSFLAQATAKVVENSGSYCRGK